MSINYDQIYNEIKGGSPPTASAPPEKRSLGQTGTTAIKNFPGSFARLLRDTGAAAINVLNPNLDKNTLVALGRTGLGAVESIPGVKKIIGRGKNAPPDQNEEAFHHLVGYFKNRYGNIDALKETIANDPAGFLLDASSLLDAGGVGARAASVGGKVEELSRAGSAVSEAARAANPITQTGRVVGKAAEKVKLGWGTKQFDEPTAAVFHEAGIQPLAGMVTRNRAVQNIYAFASKYLFGGRLDDRIDQMTQELSKRANDISASVAAGTHNLGNAELGQAIKERFNGYLDRFRNESEVMYNPVVAAIGDRTGVTTATKTALKGILERKNSVLGGDPTAHEFQRILDAVDPNEELLRRGIPQKAIPKEPVKPVTIVELRNTRSRIGQLWKKTEDPAYGELYAALSDDLMRSTKLIAPEIGARLEQADLAYRTGMEMIQEGVGRSIQASTSPEAIVQNVVRPNRPTYLRQLRGMVGDKNMELIGGSVLKNIIDKASKEVSVPSTTIQGAVEKAVVIDPAKFLAAAESWPDETLKAVLTDDQASRLIAAKQKMRGVDVMKSAAGRMGKVREGSQTAFTQANFRAIAESIGALGSLFAGHPMPLGLVATTLFGESQLSRFLDSPLGYKFFTQGVTLPLGPRTIETLTQPRITAPATVVTKSQQ